MPFVLARSLLILAVAFSTMGNLATAFADDPLVFISSFSGGDKGGIQAYRLNLDSGELKLAQRTGDNPNPFFLALSSNNKFLYSIHAKNFGGKENEEVAAYEIVSRDGQLKRLNRQSAMGTAACYLDVDATGKAVVVSNYTTGNVASLSVKEDGSLGDVVSTIQHSGTGADPARQKGPHAHCIVVSPDNKFAYSADLGLDQIMIYKLDPATAKLTANQPAFAKTPATAGPRHLTFHPNGKHVYVINELSNSVTVFDYNAETGALVETQTISTLPKDFDGKSYCADLKITPDGKFLYGTNRGHDSLAAYRIGDNGQLKLIGIEPSLGKGPQNLLIAPGGKLLLCANMPGNNVAIFRIDPQTGALKSAGTPIEHASPSCIMLVP